MSGWSTDEITQRLRIEFADDPMMRVIHETIHKALFVKDRGELARELTRCLRSGRAARRPRGKVDTRGQILSRVMIANGPPRSRTAGRPDTGRGI